MIRRSRVVIVICPSLEETVRAIDPRAPVVLIENAPGSGEAPAAGEGRAVRAALGLAAGDAGRALHRHVRGVSGARSAVRRGRRRPRAHGRTRGCCWPAASPAQVETRAGEARAAASPRPRALRRRAARPTRSRRTSLPPTCSCRRDRGHEHAAQDLSVPALRQADRRDAAADAHAGARRRHGDSDRRDAATFADGILDGARPIRRARRRSGAHAQRAGRDEVQLRGVSRLQPTRAGVRCVSPADEPAVAGDSREGDAARRRRRFAAITTATRYYADPGAAARFDAAALRRPDRPDCWSRRRRACCSRASGADRGPPHPRRRHRHGPRGACCSRARGALVTGVDASRGDADGRRAPRRRAGHRPSRSSAATRTRCRFPTAAFDAAVSPARAHAHAGLAAVRRRALPRVARARRRSTIPSLASAAALQSGGPSRRARPSAARTEPYRVFRDATIARALRARTASASSLVHRQFVLPIALHKAIGSRRLHASASSGALAARRPAAPVRLAGHARGRTVRVLVTGATGFTGRPPGARRWPAPAATTCARSCAIARAGAADLGRGGHRAACRATCADAGERSTRDRRASTSSTTSPRSTAGRPAGADLSRRQRRRPSARLVEAAADRRRAARRALQHGRRARRHRASAGERGRAAQARRRLPGDEARRRAPAREAARAHRHRGDDRPADRHLRSRRSRGC